MPDVLRQLQEDFYGRALAAEPLDEVALVLVRKDYSEQELQRLLGTVKGRGGKVGAAVLVNMPVLSVSDPDVPGPRTSIVQTLTVLEHPTINAGSTGCGKTAEQIALSLLQLFHHFNPAGISQVFVGSTAAIVPEGGFDGLVGYTVTLQAPLQLSAQRKVATPRIAAAPTSGLPATVTITCATVGASIYTTTDGSYPSASNPNATLYAAPFEVAAAATVRATASLSGLQQSDVAQLCLS